MEKIENDGRLGGIAGLRRVSKMLSLSLPMNYVAGVRGGMRSRSPPEKRIVRRFGGIGAITKREKLLLRAALEEAALPRLRVMMLAEFVEDLRSDMYLYAEGECSRRSVEMTIGAMRIVAQNLVKDYPKNRHAALIEGRLNGLYEKVCIRLFDPLCSRFDSADWLIEHVDEAAELLASILQWHSVADADSGDIGM